MIASSDDDDDEYYERRGVLDDSEQRLGPWRGPSRTSRMSVRHACSGHSHAHNHTHMRHACREIHQRQMPLWAGCVGVFVSSQCSGLANGERVAGVEDVLTQATYADSHTQTNTFALLLRVLPCVSESQIFPSLHPPMCEYLGVIIMDMDIIITSPHRPQFLPGWNGASWSSCKIIETLEAMPLWERLAQHNTRDGASAPGRSPSCRRPPSGAEVDARPPWQRWEPVTAPRGSPFALVALRPHRLPWGRLTAALLFSDAEAHEALVTNIHPYPQPRQNARGAVCSVLAWPSHEKCTRH